MAIRAQLRADARSLGIAFDFDIRRIEVLHATVTAAPRVDVVQHHALREQVLERLGNLHQTQILHHARPEARVQQVQNRVLDAADVLIDRHPVVHPLIDHRLVVARTGETHEVPRRIDERIHRVRLAPCIATAGRALALVERGQLVQWITAAIRHEPFWQDDRQILVRYRHIAALRTMNQRNRTAPVALPRNTPVTQAPLHLLVAETFRFQIRSDRIDRLAIRQTVVLAGVDAHDAGLGAVPFLPRGRREGVACFGFLRASS